MGMSKKTPKEPKLTTKQELFIKWYCSAEVNCNATEAARRAGYRGGDDTMRNVGTRNLANAHIKSEIDRRLKAATISADITVEKVLRDLEMQRLGAIEDKNWAAATRCSELHGKYLKMFTDRIEHVQQISDVSDDELAGLLNEVARAGNVDISKLIAPNDAESGSVSDSTRAKTTH